MSDDFEVNQTGTRESLSEAMLLAVRYRVALETIAESDNGPAALIAQVALEGENDDDQSN